MVQKEKVKEIICNVLEIDDPEELDDDIPFEKNELFDFDSIAGLDILTALEKEYKIRIPQKHIFKMTSVNNTVKTVEELLNSKGD